MRIKELLDKVRWDPGEDPDAYVVEYLDRLRGGSVTIAYSAIVGFEVSFMLIETAHGQCQVPLHRIRRVTKDGQEVWKKRGI